MENLIQALEIYRTARARRWNALREEESGEERRARQVVEALLVVHLTEALQIVNADRSIHAPLFFHSFTYPGRDHNVEIVFTDDPFASFFEDNELLANALRPHIPICNNRHVRMRFRRGL